MDKGGELSREWLAELRETAKVGQAERVGVLVDKALAAFGDGDFARAGSLAGEAKGFAPRSGRVRELLGLALYHTGRWGEALRELLTFRRLTNSLEQNHLIADCYRATGRPEKALEACAEVAETQVGPELWAEVVIVAASTLADGGEYERALAYLARTEVEPAQVEAYHLRLWYVRAGVLERMGRAEEAQTVWRRIAAEDPGFFDVGEKLRV
jgi:tetratricopeptide (TPR) repeat protein